MLVLGGRAYDALENQQKAVQWYIAALEIDAHCYEAFQVWIFSQGACYTYAWLVRSIKFRSTATCASQRFNMPEDFLSLRRL